MKYVGVYSFCFPVRPFVCSYEGSFVRSFVFLSQGQSFCVKVYKTSNFEDLLMDFIHIWRDGRYRSWGQGHGLRIFIKSQSFLCLSLKSYIIKTLEEFHLLARLYEVQGELL